MKSCLAGCLVCFMVLFFVGGSPAVAAQKTVKNKPFTFGFSGFAGSGLVAPPISPKYEGFSGMVPMESPFGFSIILDYATSPEFHLFLDGTVSTYQKLVAKKDGYGTGFWVYEQTGYTSHDVGPFPENAYFFMDTTGFRLGGKYAMPGAISPWVGLGFGFYSWTAAFLTADRTKTWGSDSGYVSGITYLLGIDFRPASNSFVFSIYFDGASPVANPKIYNLFGNGWTWDNVAGSNVMPPYRFGIMLGFPM